MEKTTFDYSQWLNDFEKKHGRPLRVLHVGNIANNAFNNAKMLNKAGVDCDVICYNYYHIMGCPEWEESDFEGKIPDQFNPDWNKVNLMGYKRPKWFAQGNLQLCISYLIAKRDGKRKYSQILWHILGLSLRIRSSRILNATWNYICTKLNFTRFEKNHLKFYKAKIENLRHRWHPLGGVIYFFCKSIFSIFHLVVYLCAAIIILPIKAILRIISFKYYLSSGPTELKSLNFDDQIDKLVKDFSLKFPDRTDKLKVEDLYSYRQIIPSWKALFSRYDIVQAYATDPIFPMLAGNCPYVGFEHGTLRTFTLSDSSLCRNTSLAYNMANHVFVTNGDCMEYAVKIGATFSPMLHPIDEKRMRSAKDEYEILHTKMGVKYLFLCTLRHDWEIKGTDIYIRALPKIIEAIGQDFRLIMTTWGTQVSDSKKLALELGVADFIEWTEPFHRSKLFRMLKSVDVLFDQIALPHFGATAPEAIAVGLPVIMSYEPESTEWIIPKPAPILSAWNEEQIAENIIITMDPDWRDDYHRKAKEWIDKYHSSEIIIQKHLETYYNILENKDINNKQEKL